MKPASPSSKLRPLGPYSRNLTSGAVGDGIDGPSREGRMLRQTECELFTQIGGNVSFGQRLLIRRIARATLQLEIFDVKFATGADFTAHDARAFSALSNQIRLGLRDLGLTAAPVKPAALGDIVARHNAPAA